MTTLPEERELWKHNADAVNASVDAIVANVKFMQNQPPVVYMAVDLMFRPYLQWVHSAREHKVDPGLVRDSLINTINMTIMEAASRMGVIEKGVRLPTGEWVGDFMKDLAATLAEDVQHLEALKAKSQIIKPN